MVRNAAKKIVNFDTISFVQLDGGRAKDKKFVGKIISR
jgi:hypothetical protein